MYLRTESGVRAEMACQNIREQRGICTPLETYVGTSGGLGKLPKAFRVPFGPVPRLVSGTRKATSCRAEITYQKSRYHGIDRDFRKAILDIDPSEI